MKHITSKDNPTYKELLKLAGMARQRAKSGKTLLDGAHLLDACLACGVRPLQIFLATSAIANTEIAALLQRVPEVPLLVLDDQLFSGLSELKTISGVLSLIEIPRAEGRADTSDFCLLLEDIQDPGNLGSIIRSAAAAGCDAIFLSAGCADAWSPKVLRAAMGGHFVLDIHENAELLNVTDIFGGTVYAASLTGEKSLYECSLKQRIAFAIGNEGAGLSQPLLNRAEPFIIPMPGKVESLNAAAASAVCLFEAVRQRSKII